MALTPNFDLWSPDDGDDWDLTIDWAASMNSVDAALLGVSAGIVSGNRVFGATERDAYNPTPVEGDHVYRVDLGRVEWYLSGRWIVDVPWTNAVMLNGWVGGSSRTVRYKMTRGRVQIQGQADHASLTTSVMFNVPASMRPIQPELFTVPSAGANVGKVEARVNGDIYLAANPDSGNYVGLSPISYLVV